MACIYIYIIYIIYIINWFGFIWFGFINQLITDGNHLEKMYRHWTGTGNTHLHTHLGGLKKQPLQSFFPSPGSVGHASHAATRGLGGSRKWDRTFFSRAGTWKVTDWWVILGLNGTECHLGLIFNHFWRWRVILGPNHPLMARWS